MNSKRLAYPGDSPQELHIKILKNLVSLYFRWKKEVYDAKGNKFDESKFHDITEHIKELEQIGIFYNPERDVFSDEI